MDPDPGDVEGATSAADRTAGAGHAGPTELALILERTARALEQSASLAEEHAQREAQAGQDQAAEREHGAARRAHAAARRARANAQRWRDLSGGGADPGLAPPPDA